MADQPFLLMIAGPNGSGKTTLTSYMRDRNVDFGIYINPDDIAAKITSGSYEERVAQAQSIADRQREDALNELKSFSFETVMSHESKIDILRVAKSKGFFVQIFFVGIDDPSINVERVASRVAQGGHGVPVDRIIKRWHRTMEMLSTAISIADKSFVFDNSSTNGPRSVLEVTSDGLAIYSNVPYGEMPHWIKKYLFDKLKTYMVIDVF